MIKLLLIGLTYYSLFIYLQGAATYEAMFEYAQGFFFPMHMLLLLILVIEDMQYKMDRRKTIRRNIR